MTLGGKIMELFSNTGQPQVNPTPAQNPNGPANPNIPSGQGNNPGVTNPLVPGGEQRSDGKGPAAFPAAGEGEKSPLAEFAPLWEAPDPKTLPKNLDNISINLTADPAEMFKAAQRIEFTKVIPAALLERMNKGEAGAITEGMNLVAQAGYAQSAGATVALVKNALAQQAKEFKEALPELFRNNSAQQLLRADNTFFDNPAVSPLVATIEQQILRKNPNKSPAEISEMAKNYLGGFATEYLTASGKVVGDAPTASKLAKNETDWSSWV